MSARGGIKDVHFMLGLTEHTFIQTLVLQIKAIY